MVLVSIRILTLLGASLGILTPRLTLLLALASLVVGIKSFLNRRLWWVGSNRLNRRPTLCRSALTLLKGAYPTNDTGFLQITITNMVLIGLRRGDNETDTTVGESSLTFVTQVQSRPLSVQKKNFAE